jgi:hypothetical protein
VKKQVKRQVTSAAVLFFLFSFIGIDSSYAEPWLSNRYAQNCAGCHTPGRYNREMAKRRCTLSCQGCHVNPNGGGLRNEYGKWNSQRWLRSFSNKVAWGTPSVAPTAQQGHYRRKSKEFRVSKKTARAIVSRGRRIAEIHGIVEDESPYRMQHEVNVGVIPKSQIEELSAIPENDPYRLERLNSVTAGADFRYMILKQSGDGVPQQFESLNWPMALDVGIRVRPIKRNLSLVYEARAMNNNITKSNPDYLFASNNVSTRSAYILVDDLPYNSYVQYGQYRPLFGLYTPDHTTLFAAVTGLNQRSVYNAIGVGTAPNVPFAMVNILTASENPANNQEKGYVVTGGLRFVTLGASLVGSYWNTDSDLSGVEITKTMYNLNGGMSWKRITANFDLTRVNRKTSLGGEDAGTVMTLEAKYRFWRQMYGVFNYSTSNVNPNLALTEGDGKQIEVGAKAFAFSGMEFETLWFKQDRSAVGTPSESVDGIQFQAHFYF